MDMTNLYNQRRKGMGCVAIYACAAPCDKRYKNTCLAEKKECINCTNKINPRKKKGNEND